eukprot:evm.model.scf_4148.1 EVM.evm.TU.scf_4148.1   scf_4148:1158-1754(-)
MPAALPPHRACGPNRPRCIQSPPQTHAMWIKIATMAVSRHRGPTLARRARSGRRVSRRLAVRSVAAPTREGMESGQGDVAGERFVWARHWYPVAPLTWLEEAQGDGFESGLPEVQRMAILGRDIVVWKDGEGAWRAVEDRCPHRLAALSLGSVQEDGTLACRYHGGLVCWGQGLRSWGLRWAPPKLIWAITANSNPKR